MIRGMRLWSDDEVVESLKRLVARERASSAEILQHLAELSRRLTVRSQPPGGGLDHALGLVAVAGMRHGRGLSRQRDQVAPRIPIHVHKPRLLVKKATLWRDGL